MNTLNSIFNAAFDLFFSPFVAMEAIWGLVAVSLLTALVVLPIFKRTSDQKAIKRIKAVLVGHILELWLFRDEMGVVLGAQGNILKRNFVYMGYMLKPLVFMIIPVALILIQTEVRYAHRGLAPGESAIVKVTLGKGPNDSEPPGPVELRTTDGLVIETPALRAEGLATYWRIRAERPGTHELRVLQGAGEARKTVHATEGIMRMETSTSRATFTGSLLHPGEPPLPPDIAIESIEVGYPEREISMLGLKVHWLVAYLVLTLLFSFALLKPFRVRI